MLGYQKTTPVRPGAARPKSRRRRSVQLGVAVRLREGRNHGGAGIIILVLLVRVFREVRQAEPGLLIVGAHEALAVARAGATRADAAVRERPTGFHAHARLNAGDHVGASHSIAVGAASQGAGAVRIGTAEVQQVDAREGDEEATKEGQNVDDVGCVEAPEEDERGHDGGRGECDVVERVDARLGQQEDPEVNGQHSGETYMLVGNWLSALLK